MIHPGVEDEEEERVSTDTKTDVVCYTAVEASFADCRESSQSEPDDEERQSLPRRSQSAGTLDEKQTHAAAHLLGRIDVRE